MLKSNLLSTPGNANDESAQGEDAPARLDPEALLLQLERILASPAFTNSKRYPVLLRYVVEKSIEGDTFDLRERTLGVQVFGRDPDYDTNADPVVRITAGEVRKRIAQYYQERGAEDEIRIDIPLGSYVPEFSRTIPQPSDQRRKLIPVARRRPYSRKFLIAPLLLALVTLAALLYRTWGPESDLDRFWRATVDAPEPVLICLGRDGISTLLTSLPERGEMMRALQLAPDLKALLQGLTQSVALSDATTLARIAGTLQAKGKKYSIQMESSTTFTQLRAGPVVLIGAFNNEWTLRLTQQLRFSFQADKASQAIWIGDKQAPGTRRGVVRLQASAQQSGEDLAIVSRVRDQTTDRIVTVAAGVTSFGTTAAGEFLSNPDYLGQISRSAPRGWERKDLQLIIATKVIGGNSGAPHIVAAHYW